MSDPCADGIEQRTLGGASLAIETRTCDVWCKDREAEFEVDTMQYDGTGWDSVTVDACRTCAREFTEPDEPENHEKTREIESKYRYVDTEADR